MRSLRLVLAAALAAGVASLPADAAPRRPRPPAPVCNLVTDVANDAGALANAGGATTYDPSLDIVGGDVATNAKNLSVVIRLKDLTRESTMSPAGRTWSFAFTNGNNSVGVSVYTSPVGTFFGKGTGELNYDKDYIQVNVPLRDIPYAKIAKGSVLKTFYVTSNPIVGLEPSLGAGYAIAPPGAADEATSPKAYTAGAASCVKVPA